MVSSRHIYSRSHVSKLYFNFNINDYILSENKHYYGTVPVYPMVQPEPVYCQESFDAFVVQISEAIRKEMTLPQLKFVSNFHRFK